MGAGYRRLWQLAWPVATSTSTITLLTLVNLFWIGHLGTVALAAVSVCGNILFIVFGLSNIVHTGALAIVSRRVGEGNLAAAFQATRHGVLLGGVLGVIVALVGYATAPAVVGFFGVGAEVEALAVPYLRIMYVGADPPLPERRAQRLLPGGGRHAHADAASTSAWCSPTSSADPFFIFAPGQVQRWAGSTSAGSASGVDGAAIVAVITSVVGCAIFLGALDRSAAPVPAAGRRRTCRSRPPSSGACCASARRPASRMVARPLSTFLLLKVIASFGTTAIAAFGIAIRSFGVNWIPYSGIHVAVSALVGQSLGAHRVDEAEHVVRRGLVITTGLGVLFCVLYYGWARDIMLAFDHDPAVVAAGESFLKLIALGFLFSGPMLPLGSAMNGAGDTKPPMIVAFLANWPVKLPALLRAGAAARLRHRRRVDRHVRLDRLRVAADVRLVPARDLEDQAGVGRTQGLCP